MFGTTALVGTGQKKKALARRLGVLASAVALAATTAFAGAAPATAAGYFEAPYPAGESYQVSQGNGGGYSHTDAYNRYAWDLALPANYEVSATQGGTIVISNWSPYWQNGIEVIIRHPNGQCTQYAHLNRSFYEPGNWVPQGRIIGWSGSTGAASAPHLHYSVIDCNTRVSLPSTIEGYVPATGTWVRSSNTRA
ncbi:M23 family metallopeptidase [Terrabacter sp. LjRoot27]|uniref:M23 family metallopeptidase n=1 Tax=Terrabacter sp. LjRoot27 TaxID=3342306 RepID=UPI003ECC508D